MTPNKTLSSAALIALGLFVGATCTNIASSSLGQPMVDLATAFAPQPAFAQTAPGRPAVLADVAEQVVPSVVNISVRKSVKQSSPMLRDPMLRDFFGPQLPMQRDTTSLGSGVIVSSDGVVLTNNHVIEDAEAVEVTLHDGRELRARVAGSDPRSDLAVLRLEGASNLPALRFGSSKNLRLGEVVLAVGNPFGVGQTVTMGIVSALGRSNVGIVDYEDFIQTDAAINPGNSGGALVNTRGELIGINTAIVSRTGGNQGIGFAIPADMARPIMDSLLDNGTVERGWLGVAIQDLDADLDAALDLGDQRGALISEVVAGSPAARAGVKRGDVIASIDGQPVIGASQLRNTIAARAPETRVKLGVIRDGKRREIAVTLGELANDDAKAARPPAGAGATSAVAGLEVEAQRDGHGVVITGVEPDSAAARADLRPGDVIAEADRAAISNPRELRAAIDKADGPVLLLVRRGESTRYVALAIK